MLSQTSGEFVKAFGGVPVNMSTPEVSTALQQGVVDAIHAATAGGGQLWGPLVKHKLELGPNYVNVYLIANTEAYEKLSPNAQKVVAESIKATWGLRQNGYAHIGKPSINNTKRLGWSSHLHILMMSKKCKQQ